MRGTSLGRFPRARTDLRQTTHTLFDIFDHLISNQPLLPNQYPNSMLTLLRWSFRKWAPKFGLVTARLMLAPLYREESDTN